MLLVLSMILAFGQFDSSPPVAMVEKAHRPLPPARKWKREAWPDHSKGLQLQVTFEKIVGSTIFVYLGIKNTSNRLIEIDSVMMTQELLEAQFNDGKYIVHYEGDDIGYACIETEEYLVPGQKSGGTWHFKLLSKPKKLFLSVYTSFPAVQSYAWSGKLLKQDIKIWPQPNA